METQYRTRLISTAHHYHRIFIAHLSPHGPHSNLSDEELLAAYRRDGNNHWLGVLLQRYTVLLLGVAYKYLNDRDQAEDAVQHVFETTLTRLPPEPILNFKGWLYILMRNHCLQQLRHKDYYLADDAFSSIPEAASEDIMEREHTLDQLTAALEQLNIEQRTALKSFYLEKQSYEQIIAATGYTFMQVKSYIQNGKRNLKLILEKKLREK